MNTPPKAASPPIPLAVVMVDGGRMQTRKPGHGPGVHEAAWRETKTAIFLRMTHNPSAADPRLELPACFSHPPGAAVEASPTADPDPAVDQGRKREILFRTGLATHVHDAARAVGESGGRWVESCCQGRVSEVLSEIAERLSHLTPPADPNGEPEHPWCVLSREHGCLMNNRQRMDYPRYRREGLPITSGPIESWVKPLNQGVKGSEQFWNDDQNGEAILQLRSAWLGDDETLSNHLENRPGHTAARPRGPARSSMAA